MSYYGNSAYTAGRTDWSCGFSNRKPRPFGFNCPSSAPSTPTYPGPTGPINEPTGLNLTIAQPSFLQPPTTSAQGLLSNTLGLRSSVAGGVSIASGSMFQSPSTSLSVANTQVSVGVDTEADILNRTGDPTGTIMGSQAKLFIYDGADWVTYQSDS